MAPYIDMSWEGRERNYSLSIFMYCLDMQHVVSEENHNIR